MSTRPQAPGSQRRLQMLVAGHLGEEISDIPWRKVKCYHDSAPLVSINNTENVRPGRSWNPPAPSQLQILYWRAGRIKFQIKSFSNRWSYLTWILDVQTITTVSASPASDLMNCYLPISTFLFSTKNRMGRSRPYSSVVISYTISSNFEQLKIQPFKCLIVQTFPVPLALGLPHYRPS